MNLFKEKKERPYFKLCSKCHGKGQLSYFNTNQSKKYSACNKCTNGNPPMGLGVTLKCSCQPKSARYESVTLDEAKYLKGMESAELRALRNLQQQLGASNVAVLITCDCGARYLAKDKGGRQDIRGDESVNDPDKEHNKAIAMTLVENGIMYRLDSTSVPTGMMRVVPPR